MDSARCGPILGESGDDPGIDWARYALKAPVMMVHGPDFRWAWSSPEDVGWKAAATNLSDVAAMGAVPSGLVVAIRMYETHAHRGTRQSGAEHAPRSDQASAAL